MHGRTIHKAFLSAIALLLALQPLGGGIAGARGVPEEGRAARESRLIDELGAARVTRHKNTGRVRFIGGDAARPGAPAATAVRLGAAQPETAARAFLGRYGELFGLRDAARELRVLRTTRAERGRASVRYQQVHEGVPVVGGELIVNTDAAGNVLSANGETSPEPAVLTAPRVTAAAARGVALQKVAKVYRVDPRQLAAAAPMLSIYDSRLLSGPGLRVPTLVWRTEVTGLRDAEIREFVLVDAQRGVVALNFSRIGHAKQRSVCNRNNVVNPDDRCFSAPYARQEGQAATGNRDVDLAYDYAGLTYDFFRAKFGRDSLDGRGMALRSTVRFCPNSGECPFENAYWNGKQMVYGDGFASADDVVGHELAHGVTDFTSGLFYYYQSGAINESLSDVFGEFIDLTYDTATDNDSAAVRWDIGEDLPASIGTIRDMQNPGRFGDPDRMRSPNYWSSSDDAGGVHINSGINNKAATLMVDGGAFNGVTVPAIGLDKAARVYYEAATNLLTSASDYNDLYDILYQACGNLVGSSGITWTHCRSVRAASTATEMNVQPTTGVTHPEAPICPGGQYPADLFSDTLENTASGNWVKGRIAGASNWAYPQNTNDYPPGEMASTYATSGTYNLWGDDPNASSNFWIAKATGFTAPSGRTTYLRFNHAFSFEEGGYFGGAYYDGGIVEYSTNNGSTWVDAGPLFTSDGRGYTGTLDGTNPLGARRAFAGRSNGYLSSRLNLTSLAGRSVRFRFRIGSDSSVADYGWFIDDVRAYTCGARTIPATTNKLKNAGFEYDDNNDAWPDSWGHDNSGLRMPTLRRTGQYALRNRSADGRWHVIRQDVGGITAGATYRVGGYVNAPATTTRLSYYVDVEFRNGAGGIIQRKVVRQFTTHTNGAWTPVSGTLIAPVGALVARVRVVYLGTGGTVYADEIYFGP